MTFDRKADSNRKNSQKSTGPRSDSGRRRGGRNALRHGLAVASELTHPLPTRSSSLERGLVTVYGGKTAGELARRVAEAEMDLLRIRKLRAERFKTTYGNPEPTLKDYAELNASLAKLERYERRAFSRRKSALSAMMGDWSGIRLCATATVRCADPLKKVAAERSQIDK